MHPLLQNYVKGNSGAPAPASGANVKVTNPLLQNYMKTYVPPKVTPVKATPTPKPSPSIANKSFHGWSLGRVLTDIGHGAKSAGKAVASPAVDIVRGQGGKAVHDLSRLSNDVTGGTLNTVAQSAKNEVGSIIRPQKGSGVANILKDQVAAQKRLPTLSPTTQKLLKTLTGGGFGNGVSQQLKVNKMLANGAKEADIQNFLKQSIKQNTTATKKAIGTGIALATMGVGGGEAAGLKAATKLGSKAIVKKVGKEATVGAVGNTGATLASNPDASEKQLVKSAIVGGAIGGVTPIAAKGLSGAITRATGKLPIPRSALDNHVAPIQTMIQEIPKIQKEPKISTSEKGVVSSRKDVKQVPLKSLTSYEGAPDKVKVAEYKAQIQSGKNIKPLVVVKDKAGNLGVEDGKHRLEAYKQLGVEKVPVVEKNAINRTEGLNTIPETKITGSALRTEVKAVEAGMKGDIPNKATYNTQSYKTEAQNAVKLLKESPEQAQEIAMGRQPGNNASHEAAIYHAVANDALTQAKKTGDYSKVTELASSPRHTAVSEAAQKLGAEGFNVNPHDPIKIMADVAKTRQKAKNTSVAKEAANIGKQIKANPMKISRQDWHSFIHELRCR